MQAINLFELASQQAKWVTAKQAAVASNIANANTQNFAPLEVAPFKEVLDKTSGGLRVTDPRHIAPAVAGDGYAIEEREREGDEVVKVSLQDELIDAGEVRKAYEMNTAIVKAFHRMILMTAAKG